MLLWEVRGAEQVEGIVNRLKRNLKDNLPPGLKSGPWKVATVKLGWKVKLSHHIVNNAFIYSLNL